MATPSGRAGDHQSDPSRETKQVSGRGMNGRPPPTTAGPPTDPGTSTVWVTASQYELAAEREQSLDDLDGLRMPASDPNHAPFDSTVDLKRPFQERKSPEQ